MSSSHFWWNITRCVSSWEESISHQDTLSWPRKFKKSAQSLTQNTRKMVYNVMIYIEKLYQGYSTILHRQFRNSVMTYSHIPDKYVSITKNSSRKFESFLWNFLLVFFVYYHLKIILLDLLLFQIGSLSQRQK